MGDALAIFYNDGQNVLMPYRNAGDHGRGAASPISTGEGDRQNSSNR